MVVYVKGRALWNDRSQLQKVDGWKWRCWGLRSGKNFLIENAERGHCF